MRKTTAFWLIAIVCAACGPEPVPQKKAGSASATAPASAPASGSSPAPAKPPPEFPVLSETVADYQILRYRVGGFEELPLEQKTLAYYLSEAALSGRDIIYDQKYKHNLAIRKTLEAAIRAYKGDKNAEPYKKLVEYAKRFWIARGIHHDYGNSKLVPGFSQEEFAQLVKAANPAELPLEADKKRTVDELVEWLSPILFDPKVAPTNVSHDKNGDLIAGSSNNFYEGVTQKEVEAFYKEKVDPKEKHPISWGLNSKLVKEGDKLVEKVWKVGGMYGPAIEKIVHWLTLASGVAENPDQKAALDKLIEYYKSGDLRLFDEYNVLWVKDTSSRLDTINGFIETYGDALGYRGTWEAVVQMRDELRTKRISAIASAAQWFEDNSPIEDKHKKKNVVGISARVVTIVAEGGDAAPTTPVGINLPNADWIRKEHGSKSVFLGNIVDAYQDVVASSGLLEEFSFSPEEVARAKKHGTLSYSLKVDMHEAIGHASGQLEEGVTGEALKNYGAALEEARADLVALYYVMDPKLVELGVMSDLEVGKAGYEGYLQNGLLVQLARIEPGKDIVQAHMRNRQMVCAWAYDKGKKDNVIERVEKDGKIFFVIRDFDKLRQLWGELLREVQRIKSTGDYEAGKKLVETYGVKVDQDVHKNVLERYNKLGAKPYSAFIQPRIVPVEKDGKIVDVVVEYPDDFVAQQLEYGQKYAFLPVNN